MNHYVARLDRRAVVAALGTLKRIGFAVFMPIQREFMIRRNKRVIVEKHPLQDYAFITGASPWKVRGFAIGVKELLKANGEWITVHESEIAHLRDQEKQKPTFKGIPRDTLVRVIAGPLACDTRTGRVTRSKPHRGRVWVEFPDAPPVELYMGQVERV